MFRGCYSTGWWGGACIGFGINKSRVAFALIASLCKCIHATAFASGLVKMDIVAV